MKDRIGSHAIEVRGSQKPETKEELLEAFSTGDARGIITKTSLAGYGLNWQHCNRMIFAGRNFSYENYYQGVRRCWRFGQKRPVTVDIVMTEGERKIMKNLQRKAKDAERMFDNLVAEMNSAVGIERVDKMTNGMEVPIWLS